MLRSRLKWYKHRQTLTTRSPDAPVSCTVWQPRTNVWCDARKAFQKRSLYPRTTHNSFTVWCDSWVKDRRRHFEHGKVNLVADPIQDGYLQYKNINLHGTEMFAETAWWYNPLPDIDCRISWHTWSESIENQDTTRNQRMIRYQEKHFKNATSHFPNLPQ